MIVYGVRKAFPEKITKLKRKGSKVLTAKKWTEFQNRRTPV